MSDTIFSPFSLLRFILFHSFPSFPISIVAHDVVASVVAVKAETTFVVSVVHEAKLASLLDGEEMPQPLPPPLSLNPQLPYVLDFSLLAPVCWVFLHLTRLRKDQPFLFTSKLEEK